VSDFYDYKKQTERQLETTWKTYTVWYTVIIILSIFHPYSKKLEFIKNPLFKIRSDPNSQILVLLVSKFYSGNGSDKFQIRKRRKTRLKFFLIFYNKKQHSKIIQFSFSNNVENLLETLSVEGNTVVGRYSKSLPLEHLLNRMVSYLTKQTIWRFFFTS